MLSRVISTSMAARVISRALPLVGDLSFRPPLPHLFVVTASYSATSLLFGSSRFSIRNDSCGLRGKNVIVSARREYRRSRVRRVSAAAKKVKEKELELSVKIGIEEQLPEDPELLDIAEMMRLNVPMAMKLALERLNDTKYKTRETAIKDLCGFESVELSVLLCNDEFIRKLNKDWRDEDHATDVLSMSQHIPELKFHILMLGDIVISVETAARQAQERGHSLIDEIRILVVHGLLHLLGFDHEISDEAEREMENEEEILLKGLGWKGKGLIQSACESGGDNGNPHGDYADDRKKEGSLRFYRPKFSYIFCDMDGTLLNSKSQLSLATAEALNEATSRGVKVVIATGKTEFLLFIRKFDKWHMLLQTKVSHQFMTQAKVTRRESLTLIKHLLNLLKGCKSAKTVRQIHAQMLINSIQMPMPNFVLSKIISLRDFSYATLFFAQIAINSYAFNVMIRGFATTWQRFDLALEAFAKMQFLGVERDNFTYPFVFKSCGSLSKLKLGRVVHGEVMKVGLISDLHVANSLITMYARCGEMCRARQVFDEMSDRDSVSWNSIISGYSGSGHAKEAVEMFELMRGEGFSPEEMTLASVLGACGDLGDLSLGRWIEEYVKDKCMEVNSYIGSALINMYGKCGELDSAKKVFDNTPCKEIIIWNAMITGFAQNGKSSEALSLFGALRDHGPDPNEITLIEVLSACASIGALDLGKWVDEYASRRDIRYNIYVATALVDMYAKCGDLGRASHVFETMPQRNDVSWNAMISAHAFHGRPEDALALFQQMIEEEKSISPNDVTFVALLSACVHAGLVDEGRRLFDAMGSIFQLTPKVEHYSCMVDLLSRAGLVYEAWDLVQEMPRKPDEILLGALLGACQKLKNVDIGERVVGLLLELEPSNSGNYVISSKIYADMRKWDECAKMRLLMKRKGVTKTPGCSWIEMGGRVHEFHAGDFIVRNADEILRVLDLFYEEVAVEEECDFVDTLL